MPTYSTKCPVAIGKEPAVVKDVEIADIVEDTIELYILDTTLRRRLFKDKTSEEIREMIEEMSDFEEARTLRVDELPSHGHFTGWRRAFEQHYAETLDKAPFCDNIATISRLFVS